ncbi:hypothetical protein [Streptomyces sp. MNP-20]|uniref:hypothetical protein n=1 Tax=Streptomyces sp. MNP-20 TaxID=2721165 RepID=UPI001553EB71|nr:hypothetical protein [Streptomyces sp. MNP-20]
MSWKDPAARAHAANCLSKGSTRIRERRTHALTTWVRAGRRTDLDGWRAFLGVIGRLIILGGLAYLLWVLVRAIPWLMWALVAAWVWAAWKAGRSARSAGPADSSTEEGDEEHEESLLPEASETTRFLHDLAAPHVHLVPLARALGTTTQTTRAVLREMGSVLDVVVADGLGGVGDEVPAVADALYTQPCRQVHRRPPTGPGGGGPRRPGGC